MYVLVQVGTVDGRGYDGSSINFVTFVDGFKAHLSHFFPLIPTDWIRLRVAQMPRSRDLAIFVVTTDGRTDRLLYPCACARGSN